MPELHITESQKKRFDALREELEAEHAGSYASVRQQDVVDYLLDLAEEADDPAGSLEGAAEASAGSSGASPDDGEEPGGTAGAGDATGRDASGASAGAESDPSGETVATGAGPSAATGGPGGMLNLLERHDDKWREGAGEERYEVELEDGTVETARTKDDVKAILFRHY